MRSRWLAAGLAMAAGIAGAEGEKPVVVREIVVTPERGPTERWSVPAAVDRISLRGDGAPALARSLPEALRDSPSVMVQKTGHGMGSPFLRGFTGFRTLALIDGIRLNNAVFRDGPNQYWATIDAASAERLEVVGGPASVLYGSDAIGGAVNVLPIEPPAWTGEPDLHGRVRYRGATAEQSHGVRLEAGGRLSESLGAIAGFTAGEFGDLRGGQDVGRQRGTSYSERAADGRLAWSIDADTRLTLAHQSVRQDDVPRTHRTANGLTWEGLSRGDDREHRFDQARSLTVARLATGAAGRATGEVTVYRHAQSEDLHRERADGRVDLQGFDVESWGGAAQVGRPSAWGHWTVGAEYQIDLVDSYARQYGADGALRKTEIQGPVGDDARYHLAGLYAQNRLPLDADGRFELVGGARATYARAEADRVKDPAGSGAIRIEDEWTSAVASARALARLGPDGGAVVFAGVSQGFRAPNLSDLTRLDIARSNELEIASAGLDPEYYVAFEVGVRLEADPVRFEAAAYRTNIDGMIVRAPTGAVRDDGLVEVVKRNAGDGYVHGVEARADIALAREWTLWLQAAWMEGEVDGYPTSDAVLEREPVSRLLPATARAGLRWSSENGRWWAEVAGEAAGKADQLSASDRRDTQRIPPGGTPSYAVAHLRGGADLGGGFRLSAALENLLDADYRIHGSGVNEPGRNLVVSLEAAF